MAIRRGFVFTSVFIMGWAGLTAQAQPGFGFPGRGFGPGGPGMGKVITGEPYTASVTNSSVEKLANGTTISHSNTITEARDSEGRTYRSITNPPTGSSTEGTTRTTVMDPVAHTITEWSSQSTTATVIQLPANPRGEHGPWNGPAGGPGGPPPNGRGGNRFHAQVTRTTLPTKSIAGVNAEGTKTTITIPPGTEGNDQPLVSVREVWTSPDLKIVLQETSDDPRDGVHKLEVTSLTQGAPNPNLFQLPQGYTAKEQTRRH